MGGLKGEGSGRDKDVYGSALVLGKTVFRLVVGYSKAVASDASSSLIRAVSGSFWRL